MGTSVLVCAQVRADFTAQTTLEMVADLLRTHGRPKLLTSPPRGALCQQSAGQRFSLRLGALLSVSGRGRAHLRSAPAPAKRLRRALSPQLASSMPGGAACGDRGAGAGGHRAVKSALRLREYPAGAQLWKSCATHRLHLLV